MICPNCNNPMSMTQFSYVEWVKNIPPKTTSGYTLNTIIHSYYYCPYCGYQENTLPGPINTIPGAIDEDDEDEFHSIT